MEYFRIGEFAKRCGTTVEFLKFYDREGLISPVWKDESGYRYYADYQMVHFAELYKLSRLGFSVKEAKRIHESYSLNELEACLHRRKEGLLAELAEQQAALSYLEDLLTTVQCIRRQDGWYIDAMPDTFFCIRSKSHTKEIAEPWWKDSAALPEIWQRVTPSSESSAIRQWGTLLYDPEQAASPRIETALPVPGGRCFVYRHSVPAEYDEKPPRLSDKVWNLDEPLSILAAHHLEPRGDLYQCRICVTHEENGPRVHLLTRIPLK